MLSIMKKEIDIDRSTVLYEGSFSKAGLHEDWQICSGEWWIENEWLTGKNPGNFPGMIITKKDYKSNVIVDFEARTVSPCTHDINFMWNGCWDNDKNERGLAYVAGLQGWWEGKVGMEKSPEYKLNAANLSFEFEPGRIYHIQGGSIEGHCFVFVDGKLVLELTDPDPIDYNKYARVGFEAYCSYIQIRNVKILRPEWREVNKSYIPEF